MASVISSTCRCSGSIRARRWRPATTGRLDRATRSRSRPSSGCRSTSRRTRSTRSTMRRAPRRTGWPSRSSSTRPIVTSSSTSARPTTFSSPTLTGPATTSSRRSNDGLVRMREPAVFGPPRFQDRRTSLESPVELETNALLLLGVGIGIFGIVTIALLLRAERRSHEHDEPTLRAVGYTSHQLGVTAMIRTAPAAVGGAVAATVLAVVLSSRFPVGIGRQLELDDGIQFNARSSSWAACCRCSSSAGSATSSAVPPRGGFAPLGPGPRSPGGSLASARRPRSSSALSWPSPEGTVPAPDNHAPGSSAAPPPCRSSSPSASSSPGSTICTPSRRRGGGHGTRSSGTSTSRSPTRPSNDSPATRAIEAQTVSRVCAATVGGQGAEVLAVRPGGTAPPVLASGRLPVSASEIALGARLARRLDAERGDLVRFSVAGGDCETDAPATRTRTDRGRRHGATSVRRIRHRAGRGRDARRRRCRRRERLNLSS